ncbi:hypothetical protein [Streptomyces cylindrosporus]|uniref:hypothetical protein n=1 Tax=Streptomyces cylindrosporus TaxID=2927583 RepID=UPI003557C45A
MNVGSPSTSMATAGTAAFQASKAASSMMTKSWTAEYGPQASGSTPSIPASSSPR